MGTTPDRLAPAASEAFALASWSIVPGPHALRNSPGCRRGTRRNPIDEMRNAKITFVNFVKLREFSKARELMTHEPHLRPPFSVQNYARLRSDRLWHDLSIRHVNRTALEVRQNSIMRCKCSFRMADWPGHRGQKLERPFARKSRSKSDSPTIISTSDGTANLRQEPTTKQIKL